MTHCIKGLVDPIGPGTRAWNCFDLYVESLRGTDRKLTSMRKDYMKRELRIAGVNEATIAAWLDAAIERAKVKD